MPLLDIAGTNEEQREKILRYAADVRKFEIERFWQRSLFFWGFIGAAFVSYAQLFKKEDTQLALVVACFGFVCSVAWTLQNRGSKYWQEAWEQKVRVVEGQVLGTQLFWNLEPLVPKGFWGASRFSVSKLAIGLSDFTCLVWAVLLVEAIPGFHFPGTPEVKGFAAIIVTAGYALALVFFGRSRQGNST